MDHTDDNDNQNDTASLDLDDILPQVGEFGTYQKLMLWLVCLPACFPCGFCAFNQLFMAYVPPHACKVDDALMNLSPELRRNVSMPRNVDGSLQVCERFAVNWTQILDEFGDDLGELRPNSSWPLEECREFEYDTSEISSSIVIDFDLVCTKDIYPTLALVCLNFGGPIGVYVFGLLNDYVGRKKSFFICLTTLLLGNFLTATAQNFSWWAVSRFIVGLTVPAIYQIPFIISLELVGPNYRSFVTVLTCIFYTFGLIMLSAIAYLVRNWVHLTLSTSMPFLLYYIYWWFLPESPRWLLAKGRFEEASRILETLATVNKRELPASFRQQLKQRMMHKRTKSEEERLNESPGVSALCGTANMRLKTCLITLNWFANEMVYVGLSYYGPSLGSNEYLSFFLSSVVELPSYVACCFVMDKWGRRWPLCVCMIVSGISCIATVLVPDDSQLTLVLFLLSKCTISASFLIIYPFAGELYPTQLRGIGIGTSAYIAGLGLIIIPFITYLGSEMLILPLIIMGTVSIVGGISGLRLPETLHYRLPQTLEEGEEFGKNFTMNDCLRCIPLRPDKQRKGSLFEENVELDSMLPEKEEEPVDFSRHLSIKSLARQASVMDTQKDIDGSMKMTYWF